MLVFFGTKSFQKFLQKCLVMPVHGELAGFQTADIVSQRVGMVRLYLVSSDLMRLFMYAPLALFEVCMNYRVLVKVSVTAKRSVSQQILLCCLRRIPEASSSCLLQMVGHWGVMNSSSSTTVSRHCVRGEAWSTHDALIRRLGTIGIGTGKQTKDCLNSLLIDE